MAEESHRARPPAAPAGSTARYWLIHRNGGKQLIDPALFDLAWLAVQAARNGGRLVREEDDRAVPEPEPEPPATAPGPAPAPAFEPPVSALGPLFRMRLARVLACKFDFRLEVNTRATNRVLGGYYSTRRLIRIYSHDRETGRRPLEELFDTFLHEVAHHLEYTEPETFGGAGCGRVPGRMHSRLFWRILGELKHRWASTQRHA